MAREGELTVVAHRDVRHNLLESSLPLDKLFVLRFCSLKFSTKFLNAESVAAR